MCAYACKLGEDLDSLRKNADCLASGESRQLSVLIKASQPAHRRQKTMTRSIERKRGRKRERTAACFVGELQIGCEFAEKNS